MADDRTDRDAEMREDTLLSEGDLARRWRVSPRTLQRWRAKGSGPAFYRIGKAIRYQPEDVLAHEAAARHQGSDDT